MKTSGFTALIVLVVAATLVALVVGDGNVGLALAPALLLAGLYAVATLPLRYPVFALTFLALTLENPNAIPAQGLWKSPVYDLGAVLLAKLNLTFSAGWLVFSGIDIVLAIVFLVAIHRWFMGSTIDRRGPAPAGPMRIFAALCLAGALWMWTWGMARGGADFASSLWQVQRVIYLPTFYFVFQLALRGRADRRALAKILVVAACFKAVLAIYLAATVSWPDDGSVGYATTHEDSMLFAGAFCVLVVPLLERVKPKHLRLCLFLLPLLVAGMIANTRRIVWVELGAGLAVVFWLTPWTRVKRLLARTAVLTSPLVVVYMGIGWVSTASVFEPVHIIRSIVDSDADMSTQWRDWENYNLIYTLRQHPFLGTGYGHEFIELVKLPDISESYALYRYIPHNAILGLWAFGGLLGFTALWTMLGVGIFLATRAYRHATKSEDRTAALSVVAVIVIYFVHCYGDMGLGTWTSVFLIAPALAMASQLAVGTGAWKYPKRVVTRRAKASTSRTTPPLTPAQPALEPGAIA